MEKLSCIYCIKNLVNKKIYVGGTKDYRKRINKHKSALKTGLHKNRILQKDWIFQKENDFSFYVLEKCNPEELDNLEELYIKNMNTVYPKGYNLTSGGKHCFASDATKTILSEKKRGNTNGRGLRGYKRPPESKIKYHHYQSGHKKNKPTSCKSLGVYKRENGKYRAEIRFLGIRYCLGTFITEEEASNSYLKKLFELKEKERECPL